MDTCLECGQEMDQYMAKQGFCFDCLEESWEFDK